MPLSDQFPTDPYVILDPAIRWYPGDELLLTEARGKLIWMTARTSCRS